MIAGRRRTIATQRMLGRGPKEIFATGRSPCVVALHGFTGTAGELGAVLGAVGDAGYAVDAALLPGHGTAVEQLQEMTFEDWIAASRRRVQAAIEAHGRVVLLGYSLGSLLAMQIASERPAGLGALIVMSNALTLGAGSRVPLGLWARSRRVMPDLYLLKPRPGDLVDRTHEDRILTYDRHPLRAALEVYRAGARVRRVVGRIACPTLIQHGRRDAVCPWHNAVGLPPLLGTRDVTVALYERSAHVLGWDGERADVAREIVALLRRIA
ncbi:MAG TPA: alpha/beta fold hydrolase [Polyangiaceae bacterium]|jgi:carboxylesterase|nr:alpha/beta fold hydrolase [Polyangiaceae bacterium]